MVYLRIALISHFGLFCQYTPKKYTGNPVKVMATPIKVSMGAATVPMTTKNKQASTKIIGRMIGNCRWKKEKDDFG